MENIRKHKDIKLVATKKEETIWYQNQIIIQQSFHRKFAGNRNEKISNIHK